MKTFLMAALMILSSQAHASTELNVPLRLKADSSVSLRLLVDALESDDGVILIRNPRIKAGFLSAAVPLERLTSSGDALCAAVDPTRPLSFLNEIGVANENILSVFNDKQVARLESAGDSLVVEMQPVVSGRWFYTYKSLGCSNKRIESSGE